MHTDTQAARAPRTRKHTLGHSSQAHASAHTAHTFPGTHTGRQGRLPPMNVPSSHVSSRVTCLFRGACRCPPAGHVAYLPPSQCHGHHLPSLSVCSTCMFHSAPHACSTCPCHACWLSHCTRHQCSECPCHMCLLRATCYVYLHHKATDAQSSLSYDQHMLPVAPVLGHGCSVSHHVCCVPGHMFQAWACMHHFTARASSLAYSRAWLC